MTEQNKAVEAIRAFLPTNLSLDNPNIGDDVRMPLDCTMGELRALAAALSRPTQAPDAVEAARRAAIDAICTAELPYEWQSCGRDDSGIALTLQRQRHWTLDAVEEAFTALSHTATSEVEPVAYYYLRTNWPEKGLNKPSVSWDDPTPSMLDGDTNITEITPLYAAPPPKGKATPTPDSGLQSNSDSELLRRVQGCAYPVCQSIDKRGYRWCEAYLDQVKPEIDKALARLEQGAA